MKPEIHNGSTEALKKYRETGEDRFLDDFCRENLGLVHSVAGRFRKRGTEYEDLVQIGCVGLVKAANSFDFSRGFAFSTYAFTQICGEIRRHLRDDGMMRVSRSTKKNGAILLKNREEFLSRFGREPTVEELSRLCGIEKEEVVFCLGAMSPTISMNAEGEELQALEKRLGHDGMEEEIERMALYEAIDKLTEGERRLLSLRYGACLTQCETASRLGMTQVQVSRAEKKILAKLKDALL